MAIAGAPADPSHVVITSGTMDAITLALQTLCRPGDTVLVESPTYFGLLQAIEHLSLKVVEVPNHPVRGIDVDAVRTIARSTRLAAAVLMPNFNNPAGSLTPDDAKREIVSDPDRRRSADHRGRHLRRPALRQRPADLDARVRRSRPRDLVRLGVEDDRARLSHRLGGEPAIPRRRSRAPNSIPRSPARRCSNWCSPATTRAAATIAICGVCGSTLSTNSQHVSEAIASLLSAGHARRAARGRRRAVGRAAANVDGAELFRTALASRIGIAPGVVFSAKADYRNYIRLSCGLPWTTTLERAIEKLGRLVTDMAKG